MYSKVQTNMGFDLSSESQSKSGNLNNVQLMLQEFKNECYCLYLLGRPPELNQKDGYFQMLKSLPQKKFHLKNFKEVKGYFNQFLRFYKKEMKQLKKLNDDMELESYIGLLIKTLNFIERFLNINHYKNQLLYLKQEHENNQNFQARNNDFKEFKQIGFNRQPLGDLQLPFEDHQEEQIIPQEGYNDLDEEELYFQSLSESEQNKKEIIQLWTKLGLDKLPLDDTDKDYYSEIDGDRITLHESNQYQGKNNVVLNIPLEQVLNIEKPMVPNPAQKIDNRQEFHLQFKLEQYLSDLFQNQKSKYKLKLQSWDKFFENYKANILVLTGQPLEIQEEKMQEDETITKGTNLKQIGFIDESDISDSDSDNGSVKDPHGSCNQDKGLQQLNQNEAFEYSRFDEKT